MRLITTLSLGAATLAIAAYGAMAQPLRTAATEPAVPPAAASAAAGTVSPAKVAPAATVPNAPSANAVVANTPAQPATPMSPSNSDGIAATVGDNSVSDYELDQRVALFFATAGFKPSAEDIKRVRKIQLDNLIDEHIQMAEARRRKITVSPVEVENRLNEWAKRQNTTVKELSDALAKAGSDIEVLRQQQIASLAWNKVIISEFVDQIVVSPAMVDDALRRDAEGASKTHYHVMEIFLPVDSPDKDAAVKKQIEDIESQIRSGKAPFRNLA
ncbi:MAG: SurA N-terminal domain-containing protein, partial [Alphaproteobacteria bacterium]|nr:SurA N-terminal domain-containing protein [Alphaproteobacteria bacterium]